MQGMYWAAYRKFIERNAMPWARMRYYRSSTGFKDTISICDFTLPRREGVVSTGWSLADWYRDSNVVTCGIVDGYVPLFTNASIWNEEKNTWDKWPVRGMIDVTKDLKRRGCLRPTQEVIDLVQHWVCPKSDW